MNTPIQDKLLNYSPEPPARVWDAIQAAMDKEDTALSKRLFNYQQTPPAHIWDQISRSMNERFGARVVPVLKRIGTPLKYAAALIILASLAFVATMLMNNNNGQDTISLTTTSTLPVDTQKKTPVKLQKENGFEEEPVITMNESATVNYKRFTEPSKRKEPKKIAGKYIVYNDDDGKTMRVSKKVLPLVACAEENLTCVLHLRDLQNKAASTMSTDFTGVLEMLSNLRENQK